MIKTAKVVFVIDPCWLPSEIEKIREFVDSIRGNRKVRLIFTHSDYDHIIGYGAFPDATVTASAMFKKKRDIQSDVDAAIQWDREHYIVRPYEHRIPIVDRAIDQDGRALNYSGTVLTFYFAPGHTPEGMMIVYEPAGVLIAGDYLSDCEFPFIEDSVQKYYRTLSKVERILRSHTIRFMVPGHGSVAHTVEEIRKRKRESEEYLDDLSNLDMTAEQFDAKYGSRYSNWYSIRKFHEAQQSRLRSGHLK